MIFHRSIFDRLKSEIDANEVTVITGMRQVGKTTALNYLHGLVNSDNKIILTMESPFHRNVFEERNYDDAWNNLAQFGITNEKKAYIFIDEV